MRNSLKLKKTALAMSLVLAAVYPGCDTEVDRVDIVGPNGERAALRQIVSNPLTVNPDTTAVAVNIGRYEGELSSDEAAEAIVSLDARDVSIDYFVSGATADDPDALNAAEVVDELRVAFGVAEIGAIDRFEDAAMAGEFLLDVVDGNVVEVTDLALIADDEVTGILAGEFELWAMAQATFSGEVTIKQIRISSSGPAEGGFGNGNANGNTNGNANGNTNGNGNQTCSDGSIRLAANLSGIGGQSGFSDYRLEPGRERFRVNVSGFLPGGYPVTINGVTVGQMNVGNSGSGFLEFDSNNGTIPPGFPNPGVGDVVGVGGIASGTYFLNCS